MVMEMQDELKACQCCSDQCSLAEVNSGQNRISHHNEKTIKELTNRMNRIEGQVRGIKGMIERHVYCDDILNQIASVQSALHGVSKLLLEKHMKSCVIERLEAKDVEVIDEVLKTIFKMMK